MREIWRPVFGWEGVYEVSSIGRVRRVLRSNRSGVGYVLSPRRNRKGYLTVRLMRGERDQARTVHSLVAEAFIRPRPRGLQIDHVDGVKANNRPKNLEWVTCAENIRRAAARGLRAIFRGSKSGRAKITEKDVRRIRSRCARGDSQREVGEEFGLTQANVSYIVLRRTWTHVK